ncbi:MAG: DEAD/DEAH box helicase [Rhodopirellula sp.]|nr:DEAD/DEAH box helicase [Rhodopirellula sp.]
MPDDWENSDATDGIHWTPPPPPVIFSTEFGVTTVPVLTPWESLWRGGEEVAVRAVRWDETPVRAITVGLGRTPVRVRSFFFTPATDTEELPQAAERSKAGTRLSAELLTRMSGSTRIAPPRDVIKLEDRLSYVLQPPLEAILAERSMQFPFQPFPYQLQGVAFLYPRHCAVLADEMGLGKTMQAITTVRLLIRSGEVRSVLLVCPKPLVSNWLREFALWAPEIPLLTIEGDQARRRWQWQLNGAPVKIANYELLNRDRQWFEARDNAGRPQIEFDLVILDESQRIKNRASATSQAACAIPRSRNWALTGTPVENSHEDLVGIFEFLSPGFLSAEMKPRRIGQLVSDHVLRRTKDRVLTDMPPKLFRDAELDLSPEQQETYRLAEDEGVLRLTEMNEGATIQHVFELVLRLKQICNFDPASGASTKLERLEADLEEVATSGRKAIVFSQWVETLRRLQRHLRRFGPLEYHGRIPSRQRDGVIERFREDPKSHVLLISYGAGGVGLNLQFANYVFLFDRWWNPAIEDQAINRAHRIGVHGSVTVTRFLMLGTIEERIDLVLQQKRELFDTIFSGSESPRKSNLTQEEIFGLFDLKCPGGPMQAAA